MKTLQERTQEAIDAGFSVGDLSKAAGKSSSAASQWLGGQTKTLKADSAAGLQRLTGWSATWWATGEGERELAPKAADSSSASREFEESNVSEVGPGERVPLISSVRAGAWCEAHDPFQPGDAEDWLLCPVRHGGNTFALRVEGESMDGPGGYREGEIVFVDPDISPTPGRDVIARNPNGKVTLKRLREDGDGQYLLALNPDWPDRVIRVPPGTTICGVVIGSFMPR